MEKRFFLALALSFLVLMAYSSFLPKPQPIYNKEVIKNKVFLERDSQNRESRPAHETLPPPPSSQKQPNILEDNELHTLENDELLIRVAAKGAFLVEAQEKHFKTTLPFKNIGLVKEWENVHFVATSSPPDAVEFLAEIPGYGTVRKTYRLSQNTVLLSVDVFNIINSKQISYDIIAATIDASVVENPMDKRYLEAMAVFKDATVIRKSVFGLKQPFDFSGNLEWAGVRNRYFCSIFLPDKRIEKCHLINDNQQDAYNLVLTLDRENTAGTGAFTDSYRIFMGAQDEQRLKAFGASAERAISFGTFDAIAKVLLFFLKTSHNIVKNWGVSIILVTMLVYVLLFPLSMKSMLSIKKMQSLQPKIEELRIKFKDNPSKLNLETMELYKKEKVNPFGGCLPMFLQIPVFFSLYQVLVRFIRLKGAGFLWIKDLSEPDRFIHFEAGLPLIGNDLNLLPLLMAVSMFFQQKISSVSQTGTSSQMAEQQKMMGIMMPVLFGIMFYRLPSGLVLYWFVNGLLMLAFQWKISKTGALQKN